MPQSPDYYINSDRTAALDPAVHYYSMSTCPLNVKVILLTVGSVAVIARVSQDRDLYQGWRPLPTRA